MISIKFYDPTGKVSPAIIENVGGSTASELLRMCRHQREIMGRSEHKFLVNEQEVEHPEFDDLPFK